MEDGPTLGLLFGKVEEMFAWMSIDTTFILSHDTEGGSLSDFKGRRAKEMQEEMESYLSRNVPRTFRIPAKACFQKCIGLFTLLSKLSRPALDKPSATPIPCRGWTSSL